MLMVRKAIKVIIYNENSVRNQTLFFDQDTMATKYQDIQQRKSCLHLFRETVLEKLGKKEYPRFEWNDVSSNANRTPKQDLT